MTGSDSVLRLLEIHGDLRERLARHRDLVVGLEFARAAEALSEFGRALRAHMDDEERHVLPLYETRVGSVPGGDPELFRSEHCNLLRRLDEACEAARRLAADPQAGRRQAHEFLDSESMLLHLLEHHDLRERNILYPELDRRLAPEERRTLLAACRASVPVPGNSGSAVSRS